MSSAAAVRRATYAEYAAVPANKQAMIVNGVLYTFPRPAPRHAYATSSLGRSWWAPPFDAIELDLSALWVPEPPR